MQRPFKPAGKPLNGPQFLWDRMCAAGARGFTVPELEQETSVTSRSAVKDYVLAMISQGHVERLDLASRNRLGHPGRRRYRVVKPHRKAPVQRRDSYTGARGRARQHLWNGMRMLRIFTIGELASACSTDEIAVSVSNARAYVAALLRAGLVIAHRPYKRGGNGHGVGAKAGLYALKPLAKSGPLPPKIMIGGVFDPNLEVLFPFARTDERKAA